MTPEQAAKRMQEIADEGDIEGGHKDADDLMCQILRTLGYGAMIEIYIELDKWYA